MIYQISHRNVKILMLTINSYICLGRSVLLPFLWNAQVCGNGSLLLPSVGPGKCYAGRQENNVAPLDLSEHRAGHRNTGNAPSYTKVIFHCATEAPEPPPAAALSRLHLLVWVSQSPAGDVRWL